MYRLMEKVRMKIQDSTPGHRSITLDNNEVLDSEFLSLALAASDNNSYDLDEAHEIVSELFDAVEELLWLRRQRLAA